MSAFLPFSSYFNVPGYQDLMLDRLDRAYLGTCNAFVHFQRTNCRESCQNSFCNFHLRGPWATDGYRILKWSAWFKWHDRLYYHRLISCIPFFLCTKGIVNAFAASVSIRVIRAFFCALNRSSRIAFFKDVIEESCWFRGKCWRMHWLTATERCGCSEHSELCGATSR